MSAENIPSLEESTRQLDRATRRAMRKPLVAGALAVVSFVAGYHIDGTHQQHADELQAEFQAGYDALSGSDQAMVDTYIITRGEVPEGTSPDVAEEVARLGDLGHEQQQEDNAGEIWAGIGAAAALYAGFKVVQIRGSRYMIRDEIKRQHPELARDRVKGHAGELIREGGLVEDDDKRDEKYRLMSGSETVWLSGRLREIGRDIEVAENFSYDREALDKTLVEMLNEAQFQAMIDENYGEEMSELDDQEAFRVRLISDLWKPTETFASLKDWYNYRRKQVITPHSYHAMNEQGLFLPEVEQVEGGIGLAVGRIARYWRRYTDNRHRGRATAKDAMLFAIDGAQLLDKIAPRQDGIHWFDYIEGVTKNADLTKI